MNKKDAVRYLCNWSQGYTRRSLAQVWADKSGETMDWFTSALAESGIDFRHEIDEKHADDNYEVLDVGHSTCGGYSGNDVMMNALQPQSVEQTCINYSKPGAKGDGIKACLWAGAIMDTTHTSMIFDRGAIKPDQTGEYGKASDGALFWMGSQPFLKVNLNGERFMNEYQPYDMILHAAASQPYHTYCTVWDSKYPDDCEKFATHGCSRLYPHENGTNPVFPMGYVMQLNDDLQAQGYIVQADTIEELAEKLGLPVDKFSSTVERYNELAAARPLAIWQVRMPPQGSNSLKAKSTPARQIKQKNGTPCWCAIFA